MSSTAKIAVGCPRLRSWVPVHVGWSKEAVMMDALGVAVVGFGWMGRVHTQAYLRVPHHFPSWGCGRS